MRRFSATPAVRPPPPPAPCAAAPAATARVGAATSSSIMRPAASRPPCLAAPLRRLHCASGAGGREFVVLRRAIPGIAGAQGAGRGGGAARVNAAAEPGDPADGAGQPTHRRAAPPDRGAPRASAPRGNPSGPRGEPRGATGGWARPRLRGPPSQRPAGAAERPAANDISRCERGARAPCNLRTHRRLGWHEQWCPRGLDGLTQRFINS